MFCPGWYVVSSSLTVFVFSHKRVIQQGSVTWMLQQPVSQQQHCCSTLGHNQSSCSPLFLVLPQIQLKGHITPRWNDSLYLHMPMLESNYPAIAWTTVMPQTHEDHQKGLSSHAQDTESCAAHTEQSLPAAHSDAQTGRFNASSAMLYMSCV